MNNFKRFMYNYWKIILLVIVCLGFLSGVIYYYYFYDEKKEEVPNEEVLVSLPEEIVEEPEEEPINYLYVDIKGEVVSPGIYKMEEGQRVIDAINIAGGLTEYADTKVNNLSMKLFDEMVIIIYSKDEIINFTKTKENEKNEETSCMESEGISNDSCIKIDTEDASKTKVNINTGTKEEFQTISGIGETKAESIIAYRESLGNFSSLEDIKNVPGIGDALYEKIKDFLTM